MYETSQQLKAHLDGMLEEFSPAEQKIWDRVQKHVDAGEDFYMDGGELWLVPLLERLEPGERAHFIETNRRAGRYYYALERERRQLN